MALLRNASYFWVGAILIIAGFKAQTLSAALGEKNRILIVSSYSRDYIWSQETHAGVCQALLDFGLMENLQQVEALTESDRAESGVAIFLKLWMDTKRKNSKAEIARTLAGIMREVEKFRPNLVLLGDDNATNYVGNQLIDTEIPVVFWGVNGLPLKYGLLDSMEAPGRNVTGVYQAGYPIECLQLLKRLSPDIRTFAALSDDSPTGRAKVKALQHLHRSGKLPLELQEVLVTNSAEAWKTGALELQTAVDAFYVVNHNSLRGIDGKVCDPIDIAGWYLRNIEIPECSDEKQFAQEGMLCVCDDSGFNQGYEAVAIADRILRGRESPSDIQVKAPARGKYIVNMQRARALGLEDRARETGEAFVEHSLALVEDEPLENELP